MNFDSLIKKEFKFLCVKYGFKKSILSEYVDDVIKYDNGVISIVIWHSLCIQECGKYKDVNEIFKDAKFKTAVTIIKNNKQSLIFDSDLFPDCELKRLEREINQCSSDYEKIIMYAQFIKNHMESLKCY